MDKVNFHPSMFVKSDAQHARNDKTLDDLVAERATGIEKNGLTQPLAGGYHLTPSKESRSVKNPIKNLVQDSLLSQLFFSDANMNNIQNLIRFLVHKHSSQVIDKQSQNELLIIMRSVFLEYSSHPPIASPTDSPSKKRAIQKKYTAEVSRLNDITVNMIVPKVLSQLQQYLKYIKDASEQPYQMERPKNESVSGQKQYRSVTQVLLGTEL